MYQQQQQQYQQQQYQSSQYQQQYQQNYQNLQQGAQNLQRTPQGFRDEPHQIHSRIRQRAVNSLDDALTLFTSTDNDDAAGVLVTLLPVPRSYLSPFFIVPSGVNCIIESKGEPVTEDGQPLAEDGKNGKVAEPGLHCALAWTRVAYCVTKQMCSYDAPVSRCPTRDNILCSVDLTLVFSIPDPYAFVYRLGAARFDDLLTISTDEQVRNFVRKLSYTEIYSVRGGQAGDLKNGLNAAFKFAGIEFHDVKITGVWLPKELAGKLELIAMMDIRMDTIAAQHEYQVLQVKQASDMKIVEIKKQAEMAIIQEESKVKLAELNKEKEQLKTTQTNKEKILRSEQHAQDLGVQAQSLLRRAGNEARTMEKEQLNNAKSKLLGIQLKADADEKMGIAASYDNVVVAKEKARQNQLQSDVEKAVGPQIMLQRAHDLSLQSKQVLSRLAQHGDYNMIGKEGDALIKSLLGGSLSA